MSILCAKPVYSPVLGGSQSPRVAISRCLGARKGIRHVFAVLSQSYTSLSLMGFLRWIRFSIFINALVDFPPSSCPDFLSPCGNCSIPKVLSLFCSVPGKTTSLCDFKLSYCFICCQQLLLSGMTVNSGSLGMLSRLPCFLKTSVTFPHPQMTLFPPEVS